MICPICSKEVKHLMMHVARNRDKEHSKYEKEITLKFNSIVDPLIPTEMQMTIQMQVKKQFDFLSDAVINKRVRERTQELGYDSRVAMGLGRLGKNNPIHRGNARSKIATTVKNLWDSGCYKNRINGMLGKCGTDNPRYEEFQRTKTIANQGVKYFNSFLKNFHPVDVCSRCGATETKVDVHHIDEDHNNFLPSNLEPLCVRCHGLYHLSRSVKQFMSIGKKFSFAGAHQLPHHKGLCQYLHGHEWVLEVILKKRVDPETGMVKDFANLKNVVKEFVIDELDHSLLNESLENPTAENLLIWIWERLMLDGKLKGISVLKLWESPDSCAIIDEEGMLSVFQEQNKGVIYERV